MSASSPRRPASRSQPSSKPRKTVYATRSLSDHSRNLVFAEGDRLDEHFDAEMLEMLIERGDASYEKPA